jgi:hypothetical protein
MAEPLQRRRLAACRLHCVTGQLWVVRAGEQARYVQEFEDGGYIAVGFRDLARDDVVSVGSDALRARATNPTERNFAGQLINFAFSIEVGDLVIVPRLPRKRDYLVGRVTGFLPAHRTGATVGTSSASRPVAWNIPAGGVEPRSGQHVGGDPHTLPTDEGGGGTACSADRSDSPRRGARRRASTGLVWVDGDYLEPPSCVTAQRAAVVASSSADPIRRPPRRSWKGARRL